MPATPPTAFRLEPDTLAALDAIAAARGLTTRAQVIRYLVTHEMRRLKRWRDGERDGERDPDPTS